MRVHLIKSGSGRNWIMSPVRGQEHKRWRRIMWDCRWSKRRVGRRGRPPYLLYIFCRSRAQSLVPGATGEIHPVEVTLIVGKETFLPVPAFHHVALYLPGASCTV